MVKECGGRKAGGEDTVKEKESAADHPTDSGLFWSYKITPSLTWERRRERNEEGGRESFYLRSKPGFPFGAKTDNVQGSVITGECHQKHTNIQQHRHTHPYHALRERGNVLCRVVGHTLHQATEFRRSSHCKHHRVVSSDVADIIGYSLKLQLRDWCHGAFKNTVGERKSS